MKIEGNPYEVVKEETSVEYDGEVKVTHKKGYDAKGRVVLLSTDRDYPDGTQGYCVHVVEKDGYWNGGAYDPQVGTSCQFAPKKFVEGEIK